MNKKKQLTINGFNGNSVAGLAFFATASKTGATFVVEIHKTAPKCSSVSWALLCVLFMLITLNVG